MTELVIGLDARLSGLAHAGLGRYIKNLALRLPFILPKGWRLVYFFADKTQWSEILGELQCLNLPKTVRVEEIFSRLKIVIAPIKQYTFAEQKDLPKIFAAEKLDLLHVPHFNYPYFGREKKVVLTIHDLTWHQQRGLAATTLSWWQYHLKYLAYRLLTNKVIKNADRLIVPSQTIGQTLCQFYPKVAAKIRLIYNGADDFHQVKSQPPKKILPPKFLLYVGSLYPHKNVGLILQALQQQPRLHLAIVSSRDAFWQRTQKQITALNINTRVTFLGQVSDATLKWLLERATALVQPSLAEGFGLTGVEALKLGTPVLASKIPIFQEIYGHSAFSFDPTSVRSFLAAYQQLEQRRVRDWQAEAKRQTASFNWDRLARQVVQVYQEVLRHG